MEGGGNGGGIQSSAGCKKEVELRRGATKTSLRQCGLQAVGGGAELICPSNHHL